MHRVPPTPTAVLLVLDPLGVQTFVLRLVVVPLLALGAAQRDLFSPHYLPLPVGRWAPLASLLRAAALSGGSLLRYTVDRDAAEGVSTPRRARLVLARSQNRPALRIISLFSGCYSFRLVTALLISSCYYCLLRFLPAPAQRARSGATTESSHVQGFGFSLSRSVPAHGVAEGEGKVESVFTPQSPSPRPSPPCVRPHGSRSVAGCPSQWA